MTDSSRVDLNALEKQMDDNLEATGTEDVFVEATIQRALVAELRAAREVVEAARELDEMIERTRPLDGPWTGDALARIHTPHDKLRATLAAYDRLTKEGK